MGYDELLDVAEDAARNAGALLRKEVEELRLVKFEDRRDVKLKADFESETLIRLSLERSTGLPIIGEEEGGDASLYKRDELYWVIDPLDGTQNYLREIPQTCVSIGLMRGANAEAGVVYDFNRDEIFTATQDDPLRIDGRKIEPCWEKVPERAILAMGFAAGGIYSKGNLTDFITRTQRFKKTRQIGSAALCLAYVAAGRFDAYCEEGIKLWDIAAGVALVESVGGLVKLQPISDLPLTYSIWAAADECLIF